MPSLPGASPTREAPERSYMYHRFDIRHYELFQRTWRRFVDQGEAKAISSNQLRLMYEANPAGQSAITVIDDDQRWIGAVSAIPTLVRSADGATATAYQIGDFMVDPDYQGRGIGGKLLGGLTRFLANQGVLVYTFPNSRSIGLFLRQRYLEVRSIPAILYPTLLAAASAGGSKAVRRKAVDVSLDDACRAADELLARRSTAGAIAKSESYLRWRYGLMRNQDDYRFSICEDAVSGASTLLVWTVFTFKQMRVQVVTDAVHVEAMPALLRNVAQSGLRAGALFGLAHVETSLRSKLPPLALAILRRLDPRPASLLVPPNDPPSAALVSECRFVTGDWMGF
jgi:GNAT superfamily N-acetyltransferase